MGQSSGVPLLLLLLLLLLALLLCCLLQVVPPVPTVYGTYSLTFPLIPAIMTIRYLLKEKRHFGDGR